MTKSSNNVPGAGIDLGTADIPCYIATDRAIAPGLDDNCMQLEYDIRGSSNKEWDFLRSLKTGTYIKFKVTTIIVRHLSNLGIEPN